MTHFRKLLSTSQFSQQRQIMEVFQANILQVIVWAWNPSTQHSQKISPFIQKFTKQTLTLQITLQDIIDAIKTKNPKASVVLTGSSTKNILDSQDIDILVRGLENSDYPLNWAIEAKLRKQFPTELSQMTDLEMQSITRALFNAQIQKMTIKDPVTQTKLGTSYEIRINDIKIGLTMMTSKSKDFKVVHYYTGAKAVAVSLKTYEPECLAGESKMETCLALESHKKLFSWHTSATVDADIRAAILESHSYTPLTPQHDKDLADKTVKFLLENTADDICKKFNFAFTNHQADKKQTMTLWIDRLRRWHSDDPIVLAMATQVVRQLNLEEISITETSSPLTAQQKAQWLMQAVHIIPQHDTETHALIAKQIAEVASEVLKTKDFDTWVPYLESHHIKIDSLDKKTLLGLIKIQKTPEDKLQAYERLSKIVDFEASQFSIPEYDVLIYVKTQKDIQIENLKKMLAECNTDQPKLFFKKIAKLIMEKSEIEKAKRHLIFQLVQYFGLDISDLLEFTPKKDISELTRWFTEAISLIASLEGDHRKKVSGILQTSKKAIQERALNTEYLVYSLTKILTPETLRKLDNDLMVKVLELLSQLSDSQDTEGLTLLILKCAGKVEKVESPDITDKISKAILKFIKQKFNESPQKFAQILTKLVMLASKHTIPLGPITEVIVTEIPLHRWLDLKNCLEATHTDIVSQLITDIDLYCKKKWVQENIQLLLKNPLDARHIKCLEILREHPEETPVMTVYHCISRYISSPEREAYQHQYEDQHGLRLLLQLRQTPQDPNFSKIKLKVTNSPQKLVSWLEQTQITNNERHILLEDFGNDWNLETHADCLVRLLPPQINLADFVDFPIVMEFFKSPKALPCLQQVPDHQVTVELLEIIKRHPELHDKWQSNFLKLVPTKATCQQIRRQLRDLKPDKKCQKNIQKLVVNLYKIDPENPQDYYDIIEWSGPTDVDQGTASKFLAIIEAQTEDRITQSRWVASLFEKHTNLILNSQDFSRVKKYFPSNQKKMAIHSVLSIKETNIEQATHILQLIETWGVPEEERKSIEQEIADFICRQVKREFKREALKAEGFKRFQDACLWLPQQVWEIAVPDSIGKTALLIFVFRTFSIETTNRILDKYRELCEMKLKYGKFNTHLLNAQQILLRNNDGIADITSRDTLEFLQKITLLFPRYTPQQLEESDPLMHNWPVTMATLNFKSGLHVLRSLGVDLNKCEGTGYSPLTAACKMGNVDTVKSLIEEMGGDPNKRDQTKPHGSLPLENAAKHWGKTKPKSLEGHVFQYLLQLPQMDIHLMSDETGPSSMQCIVHSHHLQLMIAMCEELAKRGQPVIGVTRPGLFKTSIEDSCVQILIDREIANGGEQFALDFLVYLSKRFGVDFNKSGTDSGYQNRLSILSRITAHRAYLETLIPLMLDQGAVPEGDGLGDSTALHELIKTSTKDKETGLDLETKLQYFEQLLLATPITSEVFKNRLLFRPGSQSDLLSILALGNEDGTLLPFLEIVLKIDKERFNFTLLDTKVMQDVYSKCAKNNRIKTLTRLTQAYNEKNGFA